MASELQALVGDFKIEQDAADRNLLQQVAAGDASPSRYGRRGQRITDGSASRNALFRSLIQQIPNSSTPVHRMPFAALSRSVS